jgi:hypothetical protein
LGHWITPVSRSIDSSQASEDVARDQLVVDGVVEELAHRLLDVAAARQRSDQRLLTSEAVELTLSEVPNEWL